MISNKIETSCFCPVVLNRERQGCLREGLFIERKLGRKNPSSNFVVQFTYTLQCLVGVVYKPQKEEKVSTVTLERKIGNFVTLKFMIKRKRLSQRILKKNTKMR